MENLENQFHLEEQKRTKYFRIYLSSKRKDLHTESNKTLL
jgi:hypothetical protein